MLIPPHFSHRHAQPHCTAQSCRPLPASFEIAVGPSRLVDLFGTNPQCIGQSCHPWPPSIELAVGPCQPADHCGANASVACACPPTCPHGLPNEGLAVEGIGTVLRTVQMVTLVEMVSLE